MKEVTEMFTGRRAARMGGGKLAAVLLLVAAVGVGLAACRGFFGQAPIALIVVNAGGDDEAPVTVAFDISGSNDPDGTIAAYDLDFGDGSAHVTGTDVTDALDHEYKTAGTFTLLLTVTDNDGRIGMVNATVTIGPVMITFASDRVSDFDIYRMQDDGSDQATVYNSAEDELFPDLVRTTRDKVAYAAEDGTRWNIWRMTITGTSRTQLTTQTNSNQIQPSWSADASTIVYASNGTVQTPSTMTWELFTISAAGGTPTQLTTQSPSWAIAPSYSPVNDDILFVSNRTATGGSSIWLWDDSLGAAIELRDRDGRDGDASPALAGLATALDLPDTPDSAGISRPVWSPDGALIAFSSERTAGSAIDIYIMDADGFDPTDGAGDPITLEEYVDFLGSANAGITTDDDEFCPYWLEDNSGIVFAKESAGSIDLYKVAFDDGSVTKLTTTGNNVTPTRVR